MSEITELHNPFRSFLKSQGLLYRYSNPTKATSETPGEPDFTLFHNNRVLLIEMKQPKTGKLSKEQVFRHAEYAHAGCTVHVCKNLEHSCALVVEWLSQTHQASKPTDRFTVLWKGIGLRQRPDGSFDPVKP